MAEYRKISRISIKDMRKMCSKHSALYSKCLRCPLSFEGGHVCMLKEKIAYLDLKRRIRESKYKDYEKNEIDIEEEHI